MPEVERSDNLVSAGITIPALTSIRAFAAMGIVLLHFGLATGIKVHPTSWLLTQSLTLFFVLSGFILAYRYPSLETGRSTARYLLARIARIWPLHLVTLAVVVLLSPIPYQVSVGAPTFFLNAFLLQAWVPIYSVYGSFNAPSFSLSIELFLYSCFPLLIRGKRWTWVLKIGGPLVIAIVMIVIADRVVPATSRVDAAGLVYNHPLPRLWEFAVGIGAASVWRRLRDRAPLSRWIATGLEVAMVALIVTNLATASALGDDIALGARLWLTNSGLATLPIAALLVLLALERGLMSRILSWRPLVLLGDISYSTYLLHGILLIPVVTRWDVFRRLSDVQFAASFVAAVLVASYLSWAIIEVPARAAFLNVSDRIMARVGSRDDAAARRRGQWRVRATWKGLATCAVVLTAIAGMIVASGRSGSPLDDLPRLGGRAVGRIDRVDGSTPESGVAVIRRTGRIKVSGWAVDPTLRSSVRGVLVTVGNHTAWLRGGQERGDIVRRTGDARYRFSGFTGTITLDDLGRGSHRLEAKAVLFRPEGYVRLAGLQLEIV